MPKKRPPRQELERKFLPIVPALLAALADARGRRKHILQGYLHRDPPYDRIRVTDDLKAVVEYKAAGNFESPAMPMELEIARYLLDRHRVGALIEKHRAELPSPFPDLTFEVDEFHGENEGLWLIELEHPPGFLFKRKQLPEFIGKDVTDDPRFKNRNLALRPFLEWSKSDQRETLKLMGL